jgi:hypothetical protein
MDDGWLFRPLFDGFVTRDPVTGRVRFANRMPAGRRFLDRSVPIFSQPRRRARFRQERTRSIGIERTNRSILRSARLAEVRRLIPLNPLYAHVMRVEDAFRRNP